MSYTRNITIRPTSHKCNTKTAARVAETDAVT